jgi:hypothetical protein
MKVFITDTVCMGVLPLQQLFLVLMNMNVDGNKGQSYDAIVVRSESVVVGSEGIH